MGEDSLLGHCPRSPDKPHPDSAAQAPRTAGQGRRARRGLGATGRSQGSAPVVGGAVGGAEFSARKSRRPPSPPSEAVNKIHGAFGRGGRSRRRASGDFAPRGSGSVWTERCPDPGVGAQLSNAPGPRPGLRPPSPLLPVCSPAPPGNRCARLLPVPPGAENPEGRWGVTSAQTDWLGSLLHPFSSFAFFLSF